MPDVLGVLLYGRHVGQLMRARDGRAAFRASAAADPGASE
jgi:hypothetical protein